MINERYIGGESQGRSFFGGKRNKPRAVGLSVVFVVGVVASMLWQGPGFISAGVAAAVVWVATINTHLGSPWKRYQDRRRYKDMVSSGRDRFVPVQRRPAELEESWAGSSKRTRRQLSRRWSQYRDWPDGVEGMNWLQAGPGLPGIVWHTPTGQEAYFTVVFPVAGQIQGLEGDPAINAAAEAYGRLQAGWSSPTSLVSGFQTMTRVLPVDSARHELWVAENLDHTSLPALQASYDEVVRNIGRGGLMQRHYVVVRWPASGQFIATASRLAEGEDGWRMLLEREVEGAWRRLRAARMQPGAPLTAPQLSAVLRHLQMPSWPLDQAQDAPVRWPWMASESTWSYVKVTDRGPDGADETWYHRTARIAIDQVGTGARTPLWMLPFLNRLGTDVIRTISVEIESVPAASARTQARADLASDLADLHGQQKAGALGNEELEVAMAAASARRNDLQPGSGAAGVGFAIHVSVSARTRDGLIDACTVVKEALTTELDLGEIEWLDPYQAAAAATCWPVARGMRPVQQSSSDKVLGLLAGRKRKDALT